MVLSLFPGLAYILLGWLNDIYIAAFFWYISVVMISVRGYFLYRNFDIKNMSEAQLNVWYKHASFLFYFFFSIWLVIFLIYVPETESGMHYIAIFTEIGASTVAAALLFPDKKLYKPIILTLMVPLAIYFALTGVWYGYILTAFSLTLAWVLLYAANSSHALFSKTIFQATHDYLTGIYNRQFFVEFLQKKMNYLKKSGEYSYLLLIDLDHFKTVNDSLGHDIGDHLLQEVVRRIRENLSENCTLSRLGGDEFIITGRDFENKKACKEEALKNSKKLLSVLKETYVLNQHHLFLSASIGVSLISSNATSSADFIKEADIAMYEVKNKGRDDVFFFDEEMAERVERNLKLERLLHSAVEQNQIYLEYQPQLDEKQQVTGAEVLARWNNEEMGEIYPVEFISIAEQTGLIIEVGQFIIESAFKTLKDWSSKGIDIENMSINISVRQFMHHQFISDVTDLSNKYLDKDLAKKVVFEITESIVAESGNIVETINSIKKLGIRFSMDDFGTGYSSLSYIRKLPIDELKIDRHFIKELSQYNNAEEMVNTILHIAEIFNLTVVAEGVETKEQQKFLIEHGCKIFQGFLYSKPVSKARFEQFYLENK
ncbi:MAG TPA: EAL domain-containing protein [Gammaproteobacteria bacterium]|nr:EAL domain-containing protein [Gammaproteobacteria bacterium]